MEETLVYKIVFFSLIFSALGFSEAIVIEIEHGKIRGTAIQTTHNKTIYGFLEIPYALPPVGNLRFKEPQKPRNWTGILNTTKITKICWETRSNKTVNKPQENEDCLYINVYLPELPCKERSLYSVVVYIYGGMFGFGSTMQFNPQLFVEAGVVFVVFNFRSGPFGFLTTEDGVLPANLGIKDQHFALKWIQRNIRYFGGNPGQVTIMGHSSGAMCVVHHILSKKSAGLFRSAIVQSASGISYTALVPNGKAVAYAVGKALSTGFTDNNSTTDLYALLMKTSPDIMANLTVKVSDKNSETPPLNAHPLYGPIIENNDSEHNFIEEPLHDNFLYGNFNKVPLLIGISSEEILGLYNLRHIESSAKYYDDNLESLVGKTVNIEENHKTELAKEMKGLYTNLTFSEDIKSLVRALSDVSFCFSIIRQAEICSKYTDVYFYQFSFSGGLNGFTNMLKNDITGLGRAGHGDELTYLLYLLTTADINDDMGKYDDETIATRNRLVRLWTNFIKYTHPTPSKDPFCQNVLWSKFSEGSLEYLDIDKNLLMKRNPRFYDKWLPIFRKYYNHPINVL